VLNNVGGFVGLVVVSVGKCYTTASIELEKNRKKRSTERGCQTLATLLRLLCEQARQGALVHFRCVRYSTNSSTLLSPTVPVPTEGRRSIFQPTPLFDEMTFITLLSYFKE
jgi:hypothetical protein